MDEQIFESGNCASYTDVATLIGPIAAPTTYIGSGTLPNDEVVTILYAGAAPGGLLPEGEYSLVHLTSQSLKLMLG
jgi:hypothetical protein